RVQECAAAVEKIRHRYHTVESLRDVSIEQFDAIAKLLSPMIARRARHVITENDRVDGFVDASEMGDLESMGILLVESHRSLQNDYEVSCEELDFLVSEALKVRGVYGARMTGGGFGGCTVNMLRPDAVPEFRETVAREYESRFHVVPQ